MKLKTGSEIWVAYSDPGGRSVIEPVADKLEWMGYEVVRFLGGWAANDAFDKDIGFLTIADAISLVNIDELPTLMISSMCETGGERIVERLMPIGVPCLAVQDYPGGSMSPGQAWATIRPTKLTISRPAWDLAMRLWPDFAPRSIVPTGSPADDVLASFDVDSVRRQARETWGVGEDEFVFVFAGGGHPTGVTLFTLVKGLKALGGPVRLVVRRHPRFPNIPYLEEAMEEFGSGCILDTLLDSNITIAGADLVTGCLSTMLMTAGKLQRACLNVFGLTEQAFYPEVGKGRYIPVSAGACAEAGTFGTLCSELKAACTGELAARLQPAQKGAYQIDGKATMRVVDVAEGLLGSS